MKFIKNIENSIRNIVEGGILGGFSGEVHPLEISKEIFGKMQFKAVQTKTKTIAPNYFVVKLSSHDYELFEKAGNELLKQLYAYIEEQAKQLNYIFMDKTRILVEKDKRGKRGKCKIDSDFAIRSQREGYTAVEKFIPVLEALFLFEGFDEEKIFPLLKEENIIGRDSMCDIFIADPNISRQHAKISKKKCWLIEDLKSKNSTLVNGEKITLRALNDKDIIGIGNTKMQFLEL